MAVRTTAAFGEHGVAGGASGRSRGAGVLRRRCSCVPRQEGPGYRVEAGRAEYESGHIPGSGFLDLQQDFSDNDQRLRFMMPSPQAFAEAAGRHGISEGGKLVLYDRLGSMWAGAAVVDVPRDGDGGRGGAGRRLDQMGWRRAARCRRSRRVVRGGRAFTPNWDPARFAQLEEIRAIAEGSSDAAASPLSDQRIGPRPAQRRRRRPHLRPRRPHPQFEQRAGNGAGRPANAGLSAGGGAGGSVRRQRGALPQRRVVTYCGGGIAASNDAFILTLLGLRQTWRSTTPSMSEYAGR